MVSGSTAHAWFKAMIELRNKEGWGYKFDEVMDLRSVNFMGGRIIDGRPHFMYTFDIDEI